MNKYTLDYRILNGNVHGCVFAKNRPVSLNWSDYNLRLRNNQNLFVANRYSSIKCTKDKSIATCADVTHLLLMFENLRLTSAKKRCEWKCNKTIISENFCVFPFVKTSGYHLKVFVFKLNQIYICQTTIVEKHLRRYYVRMNSMIKSKSLQIIVHFARG